MSVTERLYRRIRMATASLTISSTNDSGPVHLVQGKVRGTPETIDNLQTLNIFGFASHAPVGSDALALFGNGDRSNGVIVATANQKARPRNQKPGEVTIHTDDGTTIYLRQGGTVEITAPTVIIHGDLHVTGAVIAGFGGGDQIGLQTHSHTQQSDGHGDSERPTDKPVAGT
jgi:phage gp45-like